MRSCGPAALRCPPPGEPQAEPTIAKAINGGFDFLEAQCNRCDRVSLVDLRALKQPRDTPVWKLEGALYCERTGRLVQICETLQCSISDLAEGLSGKDAKITPASAFAASRDGVAIIDAMSKIADIDVRRQLIQLAEKLAA